MATQLEELKWLPSNSDRRFLVDGFNYKTASCQDYVLTHFHSDHTCGLTKTWARQGQGVIWASDVTARLLIHDMGLPPQCVRTLAMHTPMEMHGCRITFVDANHCPGAVMVLIEVLYDRQGRPVARPEVILHMGDCRWMDSLAQQIPRGLRVNTLFLDATYAVPRWTFPSQDIVIDALAEEVRSQLASQPHTLLVVAAYHIGKERVYMGLAQKLGLKVWCSSAKRAVLHLLGLPQTDLDLLTDDPRAAGIHVSGWGMKPEQLQQQFLSAAQAAGMQIDNGLSAAPQDYPAVKDEQGDEGETGPDVDLLQLGAGEAPSNEFEGKDEEQAAAGAVQGSFQQVIGIKASGWAFRKRSSQLVSKWTVGAVTVLGCPYSEHSSFTELCSCVRLLGPTKIVPTVNAGTAAQRKAIVERFVPYMDLSRNRCRLDMYLTPKLSLPAPACTASAATPAASAPSSSAADTCHIDLTDEEGPRQPVGGTFRGDLAALQHMACQPGAAAALPSLRGRVCQPVGCLEGVAAGAASCIMSHPRVLGYSSDAETHDTEQEPDPDLAEVLFGDNTCACYARPLLPLNEPTPLAGTDAGIARNGVRHTASARGAADNRPASAGGARGNRPASAEGVGDNRPASAGRAGGNRPASAGGAADNRPASAGRAEGSKPASAGGAADNRPASARGAGDNRPAQQCPVASGEDVDVRQVDVREQQRIMRMIEAEQREMSAAPQANAQPGSNSGKRKASGGGTQAAPMASKQQKPQNRSAAGVGANAAPDNGRQSSIRRFFSATPGVSVLKKDQG